MGKGLGWIAEKGLSLMVKEERVKGQARRKNEEVEKMRKGLSIIAGIAVLLFAYSASAGVVTNGLVSWWKFDETNDTEAADSYEGPHYNTGTVYGGAGWTDDTAGTKSSGALYFDGDGDYVDCEANASLDITDALTLEAWVKPNVTTGTYGIVSHHYFEPYELIVVAGTFHVRLEDEDGGKFYVNSTVSCSTGVWQHIAGVWSKSSGKVDFYVNGDFKNSVNGPTKSLKIYSSNHLYIGARIADKHEFNGLIDDVRIYNTALDENDIRQNYNAIPEPSTLLFMGAGLIGLLVFSGKTIRRI